MKLIAHKIPYLNTTGMFVHYLSIHTGGKFVDEFGFVKW